MLAAVVGKVQLVVKAPTQPRLAGHFLERMVPDTQAQSALGAQLFKARQQQVSRWRKEEKRAQNQR